jgi:hypothetical protein
MKSKDDAPHDPLVSGRVPPHVAASLASLAPHELAPEADEEIAFAPGSPERRARLQRYVKLTVAACTLLCVAAVVRVGVARIAGSAETEESAILAARVAAAPPAAIASPPVASPPVAPPAEAPPPVVTAGTTAPSAAAPAASAPSGTAVEDRELARHLLEHGRTRDAIAAAERATASDPTDAESWLILGSANQELGRSAAARAAFRSCLKSAKRGPLRECRAMLR